MQRKRGFTQAEGKSDSAQGFTSEHEDNSGRLQFIGQVGVTGIQFGGQWPVFRRHTFHRIGDSTIGKPHVVGRISGFTVRGKAEAMQGFEQEVSGSIAGKGSTGFIRTMEPRRQSDDQQASLVRAKGVDRTIVILGKT